MPLPRPGYQKRQTQPRSCPARCADLTSVTTTRPMPARFTEADLDRVRTRLCRRLLVRRNPVLTAHFNPPEPRNRFLGQLEHLHRRPPAGVRVSDPIVDRQLPAPSLANDTNSKVSPPYPPAATALGATFAARNSTSAGEANPSSPNTSGLPDLSATARVRQHAVPACPDCLPPPPSDHSFG